MNLLQNVCLQSFYIKLMQKQKDGFRRGSNKSEKEAFEELATSQNSIDKQILKSDKMFTTFSLSKFDQNRTKSIRKQTSKQHEFQVKQESFGEKEATTYDTQDAAKRKMLYATESCKQQNDEEIEESPLNRSTAQSNNQIFSMVFLNKKIKQKAVQQQKILEKQEQTLKIQDFMIGKKLGSGKFGQVYIAKHQNSGFMCAIKKIPKKSMDQKLIIQLIRQIKIQSFLNHPNIVKLYTFFADNKFIYLIEQLCYSGQLYAFLKKKRKLTQQLTKNIVQQIGRAMDYMHQCEIIHRDLKPENIIYHNGLIKICDFGWSISSKTMRETFCGTPLYVSPELLKRKKYHNKIDVWSIGVLTYELMFGRVPFDITTERDFIKIIQDQIRFSKSTPISSQAKEFISICLSKDPRDRYAVPELLEHPFLAKIQFVSVAEMY